MNYVAAGSLFSAALCNGCVCSALILLCILLFPCCFGSNLTEKRKKRQLLSGVAFIGCMCFFSGNLYLIISSSWCQTLTEINSDDIHLFSTGKCA